MILDQVSNGSKLQNYVTSSFEVIQQHYVREGFINIKQNLYLAEFSTAFCLYNYANMHDVPVLNCQLFMFNDLNIVV